METESTHKQLFSFGLIMSMARKSILRALFVLSLVIWGLAMSSHAPVAAQVDDLAGSAAVSDAATAADDPNIVGGQEAAPGAWPWQVALTYTDMEDTLDAFYCGGSLIAKDWVLTAAHCTEFIDASNLTVVLGRHRLSSSEGMRVPAAEIIRHPEYDFWSLDSDVALVRLTQPVTFTTLPLVELQPDEDETQFIMAKVTGWGISDDTLFDVSDVLREVSVPIVPREQCKDPSSWGDWVTDNMLCAGYYKGGKGPCYGDSGGPLVVLANQGGQAEAAGKKWVQVGVVSWGSCFGTNLYGVYARVASLREWIQACVSDVDSQGCTGSDGYEPDNDANHATAISADGAPQLHNLHRDEDKDWVKFTAKAGSLYVIETAHHYTDLTDTLIWLFDSDGVSPITFDDDGAAPYPPPIAVPADGEDLPPLVSSDSSHLGDSLIVWTAPSNGTFYVQIEEYNGVSGQPRAYEVTVSEHTHFLYLPAVSN